MKQYGDLLTVATNAARNGAQHIRDQTRPRSDAWDLKGASDFVTDVDRGAEQVIGNVLTDGVPDSTVLGEELTPETADAGLVWVVDPLDGTTNYLHGYPAYAVSIGGAIDGELCVGVVLDIPHDLVYHATRGGGAWKGREPLQVSTLADPAQALIGTGWPFKRPKLLPRYLEHLATILTRTAGVRRAGSASLDFVEVARGGFDGFWEPYLAPWDVAAGSLIIREAGGCVTDYAGKPEVVRHGDFVAGNPTIHAWLLDVLDASVG